MIPARSVHAVISGPCARWAAVLGTAAGAMAATLPEQINTILAQPAVAANTWSILIENASGSVIYYDKNPTTGQAPASNTKLFTTSAAFGLLGTNHFFETRIYRDGSIVGGVLTGNLNLVSEHDITWNTSVFGSGQARKGLDYIAGRLKTLGLSAVNGSVQCYGVCIYDYSSTDDTRDTANQATYNAEAAAALKAALQAQGITVSGSALGQAGFSPPGTLYYTHKSSDLSYSGKPLRLDVACIPLNKVSHNPMADALLRHIGYKLSGTDSFTAGKNQVFNWLSGTAGLSTSGMVMNDGSGLSHGNRFSARQIVGLTRYMLGSFPGWDDTLAVGCVDGTLGGRFCGTDGSGRVHAKTGSLSISIALSGYIDNPYDNRRYLYSFLSNRSSGIDQTATREAIDDAVVLLGARGVSISPQIVSITNLTDGQGLRITWTDDGFKRTGYRVYASDDAVNFAPPVSVNASVHSYTDTGLSPGQKRFYRVTVMGSGGESEPSRVYGAQVDNQPARVLIVDGNDRWPFQTSENPGATNHSFAATAGRSISGPAFDTASNEAIIGGQVQLTNYTAVIWLSGEESTADESFSTIEQTLVSTFLDRGGNLFVSGAEIGWDLDRDSGPTVQDRDFYHRYLRARLNGNVNDDANTYSFVALAGGLFANNPGGMFANGTGGSPDIGFPDVLTPANGSVSAISYSGGLGGAAALTYDGSLGGGRVVNFGFPFEAITSAPVRDAYMSDVLRFFGLLDAPRLAPPQTDPENHSITLVWSAAAGLRYRVQYKDELGAPVWQTLGADVTATGTTASKVDNSGPAISQRFYRVWQVD